MHTTTGVKGRISNVGGNLQIIGVQFFLFFLCICVRILLKGSYLSLHRFFCQQIQFLVQLKDFLWLFYFMLKSNYALLVECTYG